MGNKGGANCELSEAKCGGKKRGGFVVAAVDLGVAADVPWSSIGRKLMAEAMAADEAALEWLEKNDSN